MLCFTGQTHCHRGAVCVCVCVYLKAVLPGWDVDGRQIDHVCELSVGVVPQEGQNRNHSVRVDHHLQLVVTGYLRVETHTHTFISLFLAL